MPKLLHPTRLRDVGCNNIKIIQSGTLAPLINLKILNLAYNEINTLDYSIFDHKNHTESVTIRLYYNPLLCDKNVVWLKQFEGDWIHIIGQDLTTCAQPSALIGCSWSDLLAEDFNLKTGRYYRE